MTSFKEVFSATISSLAIIIITILLISAVYNFNHRGRNVSSSKKSSSRPKYSVLMWLYIYTGFIFLIFQSIKLYIALAPDSHITHPNMCQFYWQAYQFYIVGKLLMYLFYCNRIYQAFKGSAFETTSRNYKILIGSVSFFYVGISIAFMVEVCQWGDEEAFPVAPDIGDKSSSNTFETWDDCVLQTDYYSIQMSMIIKIIILYLGEATFSIILLRLYVRKVLQLVGHLNFSSIEVTMNSVRTIRNPPKSQISSSALTVNTKKSNSNGVDAGNSSKNINLKMQQNRNHDQHENVTEDQSRTQTVDTAINRGDTDTELNMNQNSNRDTNTDDDKEENKTTANSVNSTNSTHSKFQSIPQTSIPNDRYSEEENTGNSAVDDVFLQVAVKSTILVIFSIFSSIMASLLFNAVGRWLLDLDCVVNFVCMYLTFVFAKKWYSLICYGTHKCCWEIGVKCCFKCCMVDCCPYFKKAGCHCNKDSEDQEEELGAVVDSDKAPR